MLERQVFHKHLWNNCCDTLSKVTRKTAKSNDACKRFKEEFAPLPLQDDDEESCAQDRIARFLEHQPELPRADNYVTANGSHNKPMLSENQESTSQSVSP